MHRGQSACRGVCGIPQLPPWHLSKRGVELISTAADSLNYKYTSYIGRRRAVFDPNLHPRPASARHHRPANLQISRQNLARVSWTWMSLNLFAPCSLRLVITCSAAASTPLRLNLIQRVLLFLFVRSEGLVTAHWPLARIRFALAARVV